MLAVGQSQTTKSAPLAVRDQPTDPSFQKPLKGFPVCVTAAGFFVTLLSPEYEAYMRSPEWEKLKSELWRIRGRRCMVCRGTRRVQAHHLVYREPLESGTVDDLMPACKRCHGFVHTNTKLRIALIGTDSMDERRMIIVEILRKQLGIPEPKKPMTARELATVRRTFPSRRDPGYLKIRRENRQIKRELEREFRWGETKAKPRGNVKNLDKFVKPPQPSKP